MNNMTDEQMNRKCAELMGLVINPESDKDKPMYIHNIKDSRGLYCGSDVIAVKDFTPTTDLVQAMELAKARGFSLNFPYHERRAYPVELSRPQLDKITYYRQGTDSSDCAKSIVTAILEVEGK